MCECDIPLKMEDSFVFTVHVCEKCVLDIFQKNDKSMHVYIRLTQSIYYIEKDVQANASFYFKTHLIIISWKNNLNNHLCKIILSLPI